MGLLRPDNIDTTGDESVKSPRSIESSLLAALRGANSTKRVEASAAGNLYVHIAASDLGGGGDGAILDGVSAAIRATVFDTPGASPAGTDNPQFVSLNGTTVPLPTGASTEATLSTLNGKVPANLTVTATRLLVDGSGVTQPVSDAAGSLTVDTPQLPAALVGARLDINNGAWLGSTAPTVGQKTMANSIPVTFASDQSVLTISGTVTANGGTSPSLANAWNIKVTDGTNTAAVKAASTAAVATDPSLVVALSPNSALPTGANTVGSIASITTSVVPGTAATNLGKAEDAAHTTGDVGIMSLGVRSDVPNLPTTSPISADADYAFRATDAYGVQWIRKRQIRAYNAAYRLADATAGQLALTFTFVANTNKQLATIYHTGASTKTVKIRRISLVLSTPAAGIFDFEVRALSATTAPATGNPAITARQLDPADAAVEATCLALPTTAGSLVGADTGTVSGPFTFNSAASVPIGNPSGLAGQEIVLYEYKDGQEMKPLTMRAATAEGFAVNGRCTAAVALRFTVQIQFTEE